MTETIALVLLSSLIGFFIRISLTIAKQRWANTFHFTLTCILLPAITFVITKLIAGNIALSLGMVGALSIVRFRNPVKSPLELTIFFLLITIGIACSINYLWGIFLGSFTFLIIIIMYYFKEFSGKKNLFFFNYSFEEGENNNIVDLSFEGNSSIIDLNQNILSKSFDKETNITMYRLVFKNKEIANSFVNEIKNEKDLISYELKF